MSYIVNVHYKSDPKDLFWQYSGKTHICLQDAVDEMISITKQPHIDKAVVVGTGKCQPVDRDEPLEDVIFEYIADRDIKDGSDLEDLMLHVGLVIRGCFCDVANDNDMEFTPYF